jgi:hypothetical protein
MLIAGINKGALIGNQPLLSWYRQLFSEYLARPDTWLMVIGYSFSDDNVIIDAASGSQLKLFIVDHVGIDVLDKNKDAAIYSPGPLFTKLSRYVTGASRRNLSEIFGRDRSRTKS